MKKISGIGLLNWIPVILLALFTLPSKAQLVINEICSRNSITYANEDNEFRDWIEIYNPGPYQVNMLNWSISDDVSKEDAWIFPEIDLEPDSFLVIFASGNNRRAIVDHWETIIDEGETWKYWIPNAEPVPAWKTPGFDDSNWLDGPSGFGRGDGDDQTVLPDSVATVYIRRSFNIPDTSDISYAILHVDYDDAFVAYLNGVEIARANIGWPGKIEKWTDYARNIHPAVLFTGTPPEEFRLDMVLFKTLIKEGENILAIQGLNAWNNNGNSSLIPFLTVGIKNDSFQYQETPEWFPDLKIFLHTDFNLSGEGESLVLFDPDQNIADLVSFPELSADHSFGRIQDGNDGWAYFGYPTPNSSNEFAEHLLGYAKILEITLPSGFYSDSVSIGISNIEPGDTFRYTLDGSIPGDTSLIFAGNIILDTTAVVRARVFKSGYLPGDVSTNTYILNYQTNLPVISLSLNPHDLWDWEEGIYVMGPNAEPGFPHFGANFWQDWEKQTHVEYFDTLQNLGFELDLDMVIHGGYSRAYAMKSLRLITDGKYKTSEINYKLFKDKNIETFKRIILRNSGQDFNKSHFRDAVMHKIVQGKTDIDVQDYDPAVVFLNGRYWGIHNIREKIDRYYLQGNFGTDPEDTFILRDNILVVEGDHFQYSEMIDYILHVPVIDSIAYDSISKLVNISNYSDYFIAEMYFANFDWPNHNTKYWRTSADTSRWRFILTDIDFGLGLYAVPYTNELNRVLHGNIQWADNHKILRRLIQNEKYKEYFINRSADLFNTVLLTQNILQEIDKVKSHLEPEMHVHMPRWGLSFEDWEYNVDDVINFAQVRLFYARQHYMQEFDLEKMVNVKLEIDSIHHGKIKINTIYPDSLPWQGIYFDGNPIELKAVADSGYIFSHWATNLVLNGPDTLLSDIRLNVDTNVTFKAFFEPYVSVIDTPFIVINEINYRSVDSLDTGDWIEIRNMDSTAVSLSNWIFKDGNDDHEFLLAPETIIDTGEYLVLVQDTVKFKLIHPSIENFTGPFDFGLANEGEELRLFDSIGNLLISMLYSNQPSWPTDADGTGKTIELLDPSGNMNDGNNWFSGCFGGSPGGPFIPCDTIGISKIEPTRFKIEIFPNPVIADATLQIIMDHPEDIQLKIFDIHGILRKSFDLKLLQGVNQFDFDRDDLTTGLYFYHLISDHQPATGKFLIK
ncbi:MAG: CotH kinase family protein [Bacteroidales bacterium]|nr:CotH kinase family protein [Bacteroidales bacterium]